MKPKPHVGWVTGARLAAALLPIGCGNAAPAERAEYPSLVFPARLPEPAPAAGAPRGEPARAPAAEPAPTLTRASTPPSPPEHGDLPDPEPLVQRGQWQYALVYDKGTIRVEQVEPLCLQRARATARKIGRFAFELWLGHELVDRVRFDFPLLATEQPPAGPRRPTRETPRFAPGAIVSTTLRVPASERAASARILDRATGESIALPWPPPIVTGAEVLRDCPRPAPRAQPPGSTRAEPPGGTHTQPKPSTVGR